MTTINPNLAAGQRIRLERAELSRRVKEGRVPLSYALDHPAAQGMLIFDLLLMLPTKYGPRPYRKRHKSTLLAESLLAHLPHRRGPLTRVQTLTSRECRVLSYAYDCYLRGNR